MKVVADKDLLVKVNVTTTVPSQVLPEGTLVVTNAGGTTVAAVPLSKPTGTVGATLPSKPDMSLAYTAVVPAAQVTTGIQMTVSLSGNGQPATVVTPVVQATPSIRIVAVPVAFADGANGSAGKVGKVLPASSVNTGFVERTPLAHVRYETRTTPIALDYPEGTPNKDTPALALKLMEKERAADTDRTIPLYYSGAFHSPGGGGIATMPGNISAIGDRGGNADGMLGTFLHEHGHNFSLGHTVACMTGGYIDTNYPYAGGMLGDASRAITPYFMSLGLTQKLVEPTTLTDRMGYCFPVPYALSDYNYMKAFNYLSSLIKTKAKSSATVQDLLYIGGSVDASGNVTLDPVEAISGVDDTASQTGDWAVRVTATNGRVYTYPIELKVLSHSSDRQFGIAIPTPGPLVSVEVVNAQKQVTKRLATTLAKSANAQSASVQWRETGGKLVATWDVQAFRYVTVKWVKNGKVVTLTNPREGGSLTVSTQTLEPGGAFEFSLSDGVNSTRVRYNR